MFARMTVVGCEDKVELQLKVCKAVMSQPVSSDQRQRGCLATMQPQWQSWTERMKVEADRRLETVGLRFDANMNAREAVQGRWKWDVCRAGLQAAATGLQPWQAQLSEVSLTLMDEDDRPSFK